MFNSYVKLPEGIWKNQQWFKPPTSNSLSPLDHRPRFSFSAGRRGNDIGRSADDSDFLATPSGKSIVSVGWTVLETYKVVPPSVISWFILHISIDISTINHGF